MYKHFILILLVIIPLPVTAQNNNPSHTKITCTDEVDKLETIFKKDKNEFNLRVNKLIAKADKGDLDAQFCAAMALMMPKRFYETLSYLTMAASKGHKSSMYTLSYLYRTGGPIVKKDLKQSAKWNEKHANTGDVPAMYRMAHMYLHGIGVKKNQKKEIYWLNRSASKGYPQSQELLGHYYYFGIDGVLIKDYKKSFKFLTAAAEHLHYAKYLLAIQYANGQGIAKSIDKAMELFTAAAKEGSVPSIKNLGKAHLYGVGKKENFKKAYNYFIAASKENDAYSEKMLNQLKCKSQGLEQEKIASVCILFTPFQKHTYMLTIGDDVIFKIVGDDIENVNFNLSNEIKITGGCVPQNKTIGDNLVEVSRTCSFKKNNSTLLSKMKFIFD